MNNHGNPTTHWKQYIPHALVHILLLLHCVSGISLTATQAERKSLFTGTQLKYPALLILYIVGKDKLLGWSTQVAVNQTIVWIRVTINSLAGPLRLLLTRL